MGKNNWTKEDINFIEDNYKQMSRKEIAEHFGCSVSTISGKVKKYGLHKVTKWSKEELDILYKNYGSCSKEEIIRLLPNRDYINIKLMASKRKISFNRDDFWTNDEDNIIRDNWHTLEDFQIAELLINRTTRSVKWRRQELGLVRLNNGIGVCMESNNGDSCHSIGECILMNYIISLGCDYRKDVPYKELINNDYTNRTCDVVIYKGKNIYAIELFGLFRKTPRNKMELNYAHRMAIKYDSFMYNAKDNVVLIDIYPDDVNTRNSKKMERIIDKLFEEEN